MLTYGANWNVFHAFSIRGDTFTILLYTESQQSIFGRSFLFMGAKLNSLPGIDDFIIMTLHQTSSKSLTMQFRFSGQRRLAGVFRQVIEGL